MNDPGLDEPISKDAKAVENQHKDEQGELNEDEKAYLEPRYVGKEPLSTSLQVRQLLSKGGVLASTSTFPYDLKGLVQIASLDLMV